MLTQACFAQINTTKLDKNTIPQNIPYTGNIQQAVRWTDKTGEHIVLLTTTEITTTKHENDEFNSKALYANHYLVSGNNIQQTWQVYDYVKTCPFELLLNFVEQSFAVTDLNKDGKAEVWIMYKAACQGDINPVPMKIIMHQDNQQFTVRGTTSVKLNATKSTGGEYHFDAAFTTSPAVFRQYAAQLWKQHKTETWAK